MAYDTLIAEGNPEDWPKVLDIQMRVRNFFYIITMTVGAFIYDPGTVNTTLHWFGLQTQLSQEITMRFPIYLTLGLGILSLFTTLGMREPIAVHQKPETNHTAWQQIVNVSRQTMNAGRWITHTPMALAIILFGMSLDHILRMLVTVNSQYYRVIELPEASFGLIGSAIALLGLVVPRMARTMYEHLHILTNVSAVIILAMASILGLTLFIPYYGMLPMILVFVTMMLTSFFTSTYLNKLAKPAQRATVLSYKGLAFNAAYGIIGMLYASLIVRLRVAIENSSSPLENSMLENEAFRQSITYFPGYLIVTILLVSVICLIHFHFHKGEK